ncbi:MAG: hypothetical protein LBI28_13420 [Treponema sp.]|jgi:hypothetical protein|nr:hypothetical protein [Treponema sp.]
MNTARNISGLCILFIFTFVFIALPCAKPLFAEEPIPDEEFILSDEPSPNEEFLLTEEPLSGEEPLLSEDSSLDEETNFSEENIATDEPFSGEELSLSEDSSLDEKTNLGEEHIVNNEPLPGEGLAADEFFFDEETILAEEPLPDEEITLIDDPFLDDDLLFFEAIPLVFEAPPVYTRSFDEIFPDISRRQRRMIMSNIGLRNSFGKNDSPTLIPASNSGINLIRSVMQKDPSHVVELLMVVPYNNGRELDMLDIYNALGSTESIKDQSMTINGRDIHFFVESTRLESARNRRSVSDPPQASFLPFSETMYLRLKEVYFGNLFLRGDISISMYGITYTMTNFTDIRYLLLPIMRAERLSIQLYIEPVKEGVLVYCMSGFYLPGFIANVDLSSSINIRMSVLINWLVDSLRRQESIATENAGAEITNETQTNQ